MEADRDHGVLRLAYCTSSKVNYSMSSSTRTKYTKVQYQTIQCSRVEPNIMQSKAEQPWASVADRSVLLLLLSAVLVISGSLRVISVVVGGEAFEVFVRSLRL